jgi:glutathione S-transferase
VKLYYSATSPYVRKVMACAITRGMDGRMQLVPTNPHESPPELLADNPLSKVPCLVTDDGMALFDSPVICEYLDTRGEARPLFPEHGAARWRALKQQAMGDGILDAAVLRRMEQARPREAARDAVLARQRAVVDRTLEALEADPPHRIVDIGSITLACALGYLDFRFGGEPWRESRPRLAAWFEAFSQEPGIARTVPQDPD